MKMLLSIRTLMCIVIVAVCSRMIMATPIIAIPASEQPRILIIGAGMAGLSAAERLKELGFHNYTIMEASERIGGRIYTTLFDENNEDDGWVEMGAQWVHGQENNIIYDYAVKHDLVDVSRSAVNEDWPNSEFLADDPRRLINQTLAREIVMLLDSEMNADTSRSATDKLTIGAFIDAVLNDYKSSGEQADLIKNGIVNWYKRSFCIATACNKASDLTVESNRNYEVCEGDSTVNLKHGMSSLIQVVRSHLPNDSVVLNSPVVKIKLVLPLPSSSSSDNAQSRSWLPASEVNTTKPIVVVTLVNGTRFVFDHVIVTVSLGALSKGLMRGLFEPSLPEAKVEAIEKMGFGTVDKIFLQFENAFWPENFTGYNLVYVDNWLVDNEELSTNWWGSITGFFPSLTAKNVLVGWISGDAANHMEDLQDNQVINDCYETIKKFTQKSNLPKVKAFKRTSWHNSKYVGGSYSFVKGTAPHAKDVNDVIAIPIYANHSGSTQYPAIMFAGEATHTKYFSTVHGARETGIREANRIADFYKSTASVPVADMATQIASSITLLGLYIVHTLLF